MAQWWTDTQMNLHTITAKMAWDYFRQRGFNNAACAAIVGYIEKESHFSPQRINGEYVTYLFGDDKKDKLVEYAKRRGKKWSDLPIQLDFLWDELLTSESDAYDLLRNNTSDVESTAKAFAKIFGEGDSVADEQAHYANHWYNQFKDTVITMTPTTIRPADKSNNEDRVSEKFFQYFDAGYLQISDDLSIAMMDELVKIDPLRRIEPLHKYDYIEYGHRYYNTIYNLTLGDCTFVIPPQAISIMSESNGQELVTLRQENTQKIKNGYSKRTISIELVFHGYNQINGYKVESPEGYYYVDGLRQLLAQFKCTPFLPIENRTINMLYNIHTVALQSIVCSTVEGFPDMMIANLTLQEVDLYPYIETHSMFFPDLIDWDLFRYYYQRQLTENHEYGKLQSIPVDKTLNKFKISVLNESIFSPEIDYDTDNIIWHDDDYNLKGKKANFSFYDVVLDEKIVYLDEDGKTNITSPTKEHPSNFDVYIDSEIDNVQISSFQCGYSNILTNIQMAEQAHPTIQYMGGMDTMFNITFETTNEDVVTALEKCNIMNNSIVRNHKDCTSLGFIKLESELTELFGSKYVMIDNVVTHTVPEFPGLYICQINCVSYDIYQKKREGIHGLSPFKGDDENINGKGTKENAINQNMKGLKEKIKQDLCVENKLRTTSELYPDLKLPKYSELDDIIGKIKAFRDSHLNRDGKPLGRYPISKYPRTPQRMLHGISRIKNLQINSSGFVTNVPSVLEDADWYEGYVDPDFYVFYPETYKKMMDSTAEDRAEYGIDYHNPTVEPRTTRITRIQNTSSSSTAGVSDVQTDIEGATNLQLQFIEKARAKIGKVYSNDNSGHYNRTGPNAYDCSGLIGKCLEEMGVISNAKITTHQVGNLIEKGVLREKIKVSSTDKLNDLLAVAVPGDLLHIYGSERGKSMGHIAIYSGNGKIVHASSSKNQVCEVNAYKGFLRLLEVPALLKTGNTKVQHGTNNNNTSGSKVTITSGANADYITESELEAIAKTIANIQLGKPYTSQVALAQLIYDRLTATNAKYGNLNDVLNSNIFKGQYDKNLPASSEAYKAAQSVFCNGDRAFTTQLVNYLGLDSGNTNYANLDKQYTRAGTIGDFTFWTNSNKTSDKKYTLVSDDTDYDTVSGSTVEETIEIRTPVTDLDASFSKYFGKPVLVKTSEMDSDGGWIEGLFSGDGLQNQESRYKDNYNTDIQTLMTSFVNQCEYSGKGRLVKAFPTYVFCIVDEDGNWLDSRKLWSNYYALRSLVEIQVANYNDSPVNTAIVTVTNSYGNLDTLPPNAFYYSPSSDSEYNVFQKWMYDTFGMLVGFGPKLTDTLVDRKNIIYDSMVIRAGCRMHLRMGYGSDPLSLPVVMNGYISDLQVGDITQFVCVSDGVELTNSVITNNPKETNGIFDAQESSNLCIDLLAARQNGFLNLINEKWGEPNKYGIEHFGLYFSQRIDFFDGFELDLSKYASQHLELGDDALAEIAEGFVEFNASIIDDTFNLTMHIGEEIVTIGRQIGQGVFKGWKTIQYDLIKNIYRSSYNGSLAMYSPFWGLADGEKNLCFNLYNKTPWDIVQMAVMNAPEYIGMPMYHQFESRLFLGLPWFLAKYRYNMINGELYEEAKTYAQCHFIDSLTDIIDNQMLTTSRGVYTNNIVMYTLGHDLAASPTLYSDKSINYSLQSTKIFDSSVTQNLIGPDAFYEWIGINLGKQGAIRVGTTQLLWNWQKAYQGDVLMLGNPGINPDDYIYLNDRFNDLTGLCTARTVIHSLSAKTGFTTTITPSMLALSTEQLSKSQVVISNIMTVGGAFSYYMSVKKMIKDNAEAIAQWYNECKTWTNIAMFFDVNLRVLLATAGIHKTVTGVKKAWDVIKDFKDIHKIIDGFRTVKNAVATSINSIKTAKQLGETIKVAKAAKTIFQAGSTSFKAIFATGGGTAGSSASPVGTIVGAAVGFVIGFILDILLTAVIDYFSYNNMVVLIPLMHKTIPYAPILSGERLLLINNTGVEESEFVEQPGMDYTEDGELIGPDNEIPFEDDDPGNVEDEPTEEWPEDEPTEEEPEYEEEEDYVEDEPTGEE